MTVIRNDWLQEEGLSMPTNFEEFIDVAKVFPSGATTCTAFPSA